MRIPSKLQELAEAYGCGDVMDFLESYTLDSVVPGICTNNGCDYVTEVEPDQDKGWCEICQTNTVKSALSLMGII